MLDDCMVNRNKTQSNNIVSVYHSLQPRLSSIYLFTATLLCCNNVGDERHLSHTIIMWGQRKRTQDLKVTLNIMSSVFKKGSF